MAVVKGEEGAVDVEDAHIWQARYVSVVWFNAPLDVSMWFVLITHSENHWTRWADWVASL